ncbi:resuscitation-promoting factor protein RpfA [Saccharopolyspora halophila]|uniref:Resuscitation-promoting factor protein RpfA n=1 Tax=Saccharopolyspora halophila TaxID=405551 RepID=A0ABN3GHW4_9PSEU
MGKHRKSASSRNITRAAVAGAMVAAPFALAMPANAASTSTWEAVAQCESGGDWHINTGNGYYGGLQFSQSTWSGYGGTEYASNAAQASKAQQIAVAERVLEGQGPGAWPVCSKEAGLSSSGGAQHQDVSSSSNESSSNESSSSSSSSEQSSGSSEREVRKTVQVDGTVTVQAGDTLSKIAQQYGVDWRQVFEENSNIVDDANLIFPGQQLVIK